jgi:hypothetical protein
MYRQSSSYLLIADPTILLAVDESKTKRLKAHLKYSLLFEEKNYQEAEQKANCFSVLQSKAVFFRQVFPNSFSQD